MAEFWTIIPVPPHERPDWAFWRNVPSVGLSDAVVLSVDLDPRNLGRSHWERERVRPFKRRLAQVRYFSRFEVARQSCAAGVLEAKPHGRSYRVSLGTFRAWAEGLSPAWQLPAEFPRSAHVAAVALRNHQGHRYYAEELAIAVEAWCSIYDAGTEVSAKRGHKRIIEAWLTRHYPELSKEARNRIATLINPNRAGGAPSSE